MLGQVQPEELLLPAQPLPNGHLDALRQRTLQHHRLRRTDIEQRCLARREVSLRGRTRGDRVVQPLQDLRGVPECGHRPDLRQRLQDLAIGEPEIDPAAEVTE